MIYKRKEMPTKRICILDCDYVLENTVHKFPNAKTDIARRKKWLELIGVDEPPVKYIYLCSNHFSRMQYQGTLLNRDALPDINLHKCTFGTENDIKKPKEHLDLPPEAAKKEDEDSNIRTIRVDVELYNRIVKAGFMDLGDENTLNKRRQINTKACQTEPESSFTCAMIEYDFSADSYIIRCCFCDQTFFLRESFMFEKHMFQEHKGIKDCYNQYTIMDKRKLFELRKKLSNPGNINILPSAFKLLKEKLGSAAAVRKAITSTIFSKASSTEDPNEDTAVQTNQSSSESDSDDENPKPSKENGFENVKKSRTKSTENYDELASQIIQDILRTNNIASLKKPKMLRSDLNKRKKALSISICENAGNDKSLLDTAECLAQDLAKNGSCKDTSKSVDADANPIQPYKAVLHEVNNCSSFTLGSDLEKNALFYKNLQISSSEDPLCCSDVYSSDEDETNSQITSKTDEINFRYTPPEIVHHFLDLMKTNTILCFKRTRCPEKYDLAISNLIIELKMAHDLNLNSLEIRRSINRVKSWFTRMINQIENSRNERELNYVLPPYPPKYDSYFKKCLEFLPRSTTSAKWFTTQSIYTDQEVDPIGIKIGYECEFCKVFLQTTKAYSEHMSTEHRKCTVCNLVCKDEITFAEHLKSHLSANANKRPVFTCPDCNRTFSLKNMLKAHMQRFCTKVPIGATLTAIKDGKTIKVYPCRMCDQKFEASHMRRWHELKHDTPQYKCDLCPKAFYTKFPLEQHYRSHQNLRDFICDVCGKGYTSYKNLYCHQQTVHFRKKSFICDICGLDVTNQCNLARHKRVVHSKLEKGTYTEYKCKRKGKEYLCRKKIIKNRTKPQKYRCKVCCIVFCRYKELLDHKRDHHALNTAIECTICGNRVGETYMRRHLRQVHKIDDPDLINGGPLSDFDKMIEVSPDEDEFIIEEYDSDDPSNENVFNDYEEYIDDSTTEEIIKAANDIESNVHHQNGIITEEDLAYMVFDECS